MPRVENGDDPSHRSARHLISCMNHFSLVISSQPVLLLLTYYITLLPLFPLSFIRSFIFFFRAE